MREESLLGWDGSLPHREFKNANLYNSFRDRTCHPEAHKMGCK